MGRIFGQNGDLRVFSLTFRKNHKSVQFYSKIEKKNEEVRFFRSVIFYDFLRFDPLLTHF